jgi:membrane-associated phospholipid phosphatase
MRLLDLSLEQITYLGGVLFYGLLALFSLVMNKSLLFLELVIIFAAILAVAVLIKIVYYKDRPKKQKYTNLIERFESSSFPSLHSMRIAALAVFFSEFIGTLCAAIFLGAIALLVIYSRVRLKRHFVIDVVVGAILGAGIALLVILLFR